MIYKDVINSMILRITDSVNESKVTKRQHVLLTCPLQPS
jgi:hypothetical protein